MPAARLHPFRVILFGLRLGDVPFAVLWQASAIPAALLFYAMGWRAWLEIGHTPGPAVHASILATLLLGLASAVPASVDVMRFAAGRGTWPRKIVFVRTHRCDLFAASSMACILGAFALFQAALEPALGAIVTVVETSRRWGLASALDQLARLDQAVPWAVRPVTILLVVSVFWWMVARLLPLLGVAAIEGRFAPRRALRLGTGNVGRLTLLVGACVMLKLFADGVANATVTIQMGVMSQFGVRPWLMLLSTVPYFLVTVYLWLAAMCAVGRIWADLSRLNPDRTVAASAEARATLPEAVFA